ncbi:MAG: TIGR03915 family putative DNA repair protein [Oscillospiraceae bacterium]|nr:TIGR03915 family putative DNA repair protein [Oscillospiraceae bacterium]MDY3065036.1 TIGR03915 family putative DNA repair protein [Oscillospiraceae bacterium]
MPNRTDLIYLYDGSFDGLLCCIFESYANHEIPDEICPEYAYEQEVLWQVRQIETNGDYADRVFVKLSAVLGKEGILLLRTVFLYGGAGRETALLRFVRFGLKHGKAALQMLGKAETAAVRNMEKAVLNEAHLMREFLRFSDYHGALASVIEPKHYILPLIKGHFTERYPEEHFLIFDRTHKMALVYRPYESRIIPMDAFDPPDASLSERQFRRLWQEYYDAIAIKPRENPRCRMTHMPKRFWSCMTEFQTKETNVGAPESIPEQHPAPYLRTTQDNITVFVF